MNGAAFGGGAARGAFAGGMAMATHRRWEAVGGTSTGAVAAAHLAQYEPGDEAKALVDLQLKWLALRNKDVYKRWCPLGRLSWWKTGSYNIGPLRKYLSREENLSPQRIKDSGRRLIITAVSQATRELVLFTEEDADDIVDIVMASCAIPYAFEPQVADGRLMFDGGVRCVVPVVPLLELGCDEVDAYCCFPKTLPVADPPKNMLDAGLQAVDIQNHEIQENDLAAGQEKGAVVIHRPDRDLGDGLDFSPATNAWRWDLGYRLGGL